MHFLQYQTGPQKNQFSKNKKMEKFNPNQNEYFWAYFRHFYFLQK